MSALTETTSSPTLVGFPSHLTPSATFRPSQCNPKPKQTQTATTRPSPWHWLTKVVRTLLKTRLTSELSLPLFSLALFSLAQSCSLFG